MRFLNDYTCCQINSHQTERRTIVAEFEENVRAQLEKSKSQIKEIEALAKGKAIQSTVSRIRSKKSRKRFNR